MKRKGEEAGGGVHGSRCFVGRRERILALQNKMGWLKDGKQLEDQQESQRRFGEGHDVKMIWYPHLCYEGLGSRIGSDVQVLSKATQEIRETRENECRWPDIQPWKRTPTQCLLCLQAIGYDFSEDKHHPLLGMKSSEPAPPPEDRGETVFVTLFKNST